MVERSFHMESPAIFVALHQIDENALNQLFWGMEEEGIPFRLTQPTSPDLTADAFSAATSSPLAVGIACSGSEIVLHTRNLSPDKPLFHCAFGALNEGEQLRNLGCNAARLVKGLPLKPVSGNLQGGDDEGAGGCGCRAGFACQRS